MKRLVRILIKLPKYIYVQFGLYLKWMLFKIAKNWVILNRIHPSVRPWLWKLTGVNIQGKISIGYDVYYDVHNSKLINVESGVWIASRCLLLCHKRILHDYCVGDDYNKLPYKKEPIYLEKGCVIGMGSIIMPGVTIGKGAIIGAGSVVVKDIPAWTIAVGNPCKVVKKIKERK